MHLADLVDHAGVKENALGERGLAGVDVRGNTDVARPLERERSVRRIRIIGLGFGLKRGGHVKDGLCSRQTEGRQRIAKRCHQNCLCPSCTHD